MQQTVSLIAGMTKVFKSANTNHKYQDICQSEKENHRFASQNLENRQEIAKNTNKKKEKQDKDQQNSKFQRL